MTSQYYELVKLREWTSKVKGLSHLEALILIYKQQQQ